jgi:hypothetical protein
MIYLAMAVKPAQHLSSSTQPNLPFHHLQPRGRGSSVELCQAPDPPPTNSTLPMKAAAPDVYKGSSHRRG